MPAPSFTKKQTNLLKDTFLELAAVCNTGADGVISEITIENVSDLKPYEQFLLPSGYPIDVKAWDFDKDWRISHNISEIKTPKNTWYYNYSSFPYLFSADGQKRATFNLMNYPAEFDFLSIKGMKQSLKSALSKFDNGTIPSQKQIDASFPDSFYQRIFEKKYPKERVYISMIKMVEQLRQSLNDRLSKKHSQKIAQLPEFKQFMNSIHPDFQRMLGTDTKKQVAAFLERPEYKTKTFELGEKFGYIKNGEKIKKYHQLRNYERHKKEVKKIAWTPMQMYVDFKTALGFSDENNPYDPVEISERNLNIHKSMDKIVEIFEKLEEKSQLPPPTKLNNYGQPKKDHKYWKSVFEELVNRGEISADLAQSIHYVRSDTDKIAHVDKTLDDSQSRLDSGNLIVDEWLESFVLEKMQNDLSMIEIMQTASDDFIQKQKNQIAFRSALINDRQNLPLWTFASYKKAKRKSSK